jgi:molybdenum cofactor cytidylyltransferase
MIVALVPAAGSSTRMGRPKLTLPLGGQTVIRRVILALREGGVDRVLVLAPPLDAPASREITAEGVLAGAEVFVLPEATPDMRATVEYGLAYLDRFQAPVAILLAPADSPGVTSELVSAILERAKQSSRSIIAPTYEGRRGHPLYLSWSWAQAIRALPAGVGINALFSTFPDQVETFAVDESGTLADLDTPSDYHEWQRRIPSIQPDGSRDADRG